MQKTVTLRLIDLNDSTIHSSIPVLKIFNLKKFLEFKYDVLSNEKNTRIVPFVNTHLDISFKSKAFVLFKKKTCNKTNQKTDSYRFGTRYSRTEVLSYCADTSRMNNNK